MSETKDATVALRERVEDLERRLEASERRSAQMIEAVAIELARIREECGVSAPE